MQKIIARIQQSGTARELLPFIPVIAALVTTVVLFLIHCC